MEELVSSDRSSTFFARMFLSNSARQLASTALQALKTAAKDIGMKAFNVGKIAAIDAVKKLVEKAGKWLSAPKSQVANVLFPPEEITKRVKKVIAKYLDTSAINLNKLIDGSSVNRQTASNAIAIQDLVKRLKGSGLKWQIFVLLRLKMMTDILKFTDTPIIDESIEEYEYHEYEPITGTSLNNGGDIRIAI